MTGHAEIPTVLIYFDNAIADLDAFAGFVRGDRATKDTMQAGSGGRTFPIGVWKSIDDRLRPRLEFPMCVETIIQVDSHESPAFAEDKPDPRISTTLVRFPHGGKGVPRGGVGRRRFITVDLIRHLGRFSVTEFVFP